MDDTTKIIQDVQAKAKEAKASAEELLKVTNSSIESLRSSLPQLSIPTGTNLLPTGNITALLDRIKQASNLNLNDSENLNELKNAIKEYTDQIGTMQSAITAKIAELAPFLSLLQGPSNIGQVITWIKNFISTFVGPYIKPYFTSIAQLAQLTQLQAQGLTVIQDALSKLNSLNPISQLKSVKDSVVGSINDTISNINSKSLPTANTLTDAIGSFKSAGISLPSGVTDPTANT